MPAAPDVLVISSSLWWTFTSAQNHGQAGVWHRLAKAEPFNGPGLRRRLSDTGGGR